MVEVEGEVSEPRLLPDGSWRWDFDSAWHAIAKLKSLWVADLYESGRLVTTCHGWTPDAALRSAGDSRVVTLRLRAETALREGRSVPEPAPPFVPDASSATETRDVLDRVNDLSPHGVRHDLWNLIHALATHLGMLRVSHKHQSEELALLCEYYDANESRAFRGRVDAARDAIQRALGR